MIAIRHIFLFVLLLAGVKVFAQKEQLPNTNVPLNQLDREGRRTGPWWISSPAGMGESASADFGSYTAGLKYGKWYKIDHDGDIAAVETYKNNRLDGEVKYYSKGVLYCTGNYRTFQTGVEKDTIYVMDPGTHEEFPRELLPDTNTVRHGTWKFYDEVTGKFLREEEYQVDSLIYKRAYVSQVDSLANMKRETSLPHNKGRYRKPRTNPKGQVLE